MGTPGSCEYPPAARLNPGSACHDGGRTLSPKVLSLELQAALSTVNYHVTELRHSDLVKLVDEQQVRGAIEHFYRMVEDENGSKRKRSAKRRAEEADDGSRTRDLELGKLALYQLSYRRVSGRFYGQAAALRRLAFPARERPRLPRLPRRLAVIGLLGFGLLSKGETKLALGDPVPDRSCRCSTARARARSPTIAGVGCWSTSGPPGASPAAQEAPELDRFARRYRRDGVDVLGINVQDNSDDALAFLHDNGVALSAAALGRRRAQRRVRLDRRAGELPRRPPRPAGADLARPGRPASSSPTRSCRSSKGAAMRAALRARPRPRDLARRRHLRRDAADRASTTSKTR